MCDKGGQPTYDDVGKAPKEFFSKGFPLENFKITCKKPKTVLDIDTTMNITHKFEDSTATADVETKYCNPAWGLTTSTKLDTTNLLVWKGEVDNKIAQGLKVELEGGMNLESSNKVGKLGLQYRIDQATFDAGVLGSDEANMEVGGSVVGGYKEFLGGYQFSYDTSEGALKKNNVVLGYVGRGVNAHVNMDNADEVQGILTAKVRKDFELGIQGNYMSSDESKNGYAVALKFSATPCTSFKAKIDNTRAITMACEMKATEAATLTLCAQIDGANAGKLGASLEFAGEAGCGGCAKPK